LTRHIAIFPLAEIKPRPAELYAAYRPEVHIPANITKEETRNKRLEEADEKWVPSLADCPFTVDVEGLQLLCVDNKHTKLQLHLVNMDKSMSATAAMRKLTADLNMDNMSVTTTAWYGNDCQRIRKAVWAEVAARGGLIHTPPSPAPVYEGLLYGCPSYTMDSLLEQKPNYGINYIGALRQLLRADSWYYKLYSGLTNAHENFAAITLLLQYRAFAAAGALAWDTRAELLLGELTGEAKPKLVKQAGKVSGTKPLRKKKKKVKRSE